MTGRALLLAGCCAGCCAVGCSRGEHRRGGARPTVPVASEAPSAAPSACLPPAEDSDAAVAWREVPFTDLCVTSGAVSPGVDGAFIVLGQAFRAVASATSSGGGRLTFEYVGPTDRTRALGAGGALRQIGLKLRAQDPCNQVDVMWRLAPVDEVVVLVKRNPGQSTAASCGERGYAHLVPREHAAPPAIAPGSDHVLEARLEGPRLDVFVDEALVWRGDLTPAAERLRGPAGVRSDNVKARGRLSVEGIAGDVRPCRGDGRPD